MASLGTNSRPDRQHAARAVRLVLNPGRSEVSCLAGGSVVNSGCWKTGPGMSWVIASA